MDSLEFTNEMLGGLIFKGSYNSLEDLKESTKSGNVSIGDVAVVNGDNGNYEIYVYDGEENVRIETSLSSLEDVEDRDDTKEELKELKCNNCGAPLELSTNNYVIGEKIYVCKHCGSRFKITK